MERGQLIAGRYELMKRLGRGGMGEVWAGRDRALRRNVAIKLLVLDDTVPPDLPARFEREAVAGAQINHPNAVALYDRGVHEDLLFLVMERVEGGTLAEHIRDGGPMEIARALEIAQAICSALVAAHRAQVIHYDIKPQNVMVTPDGLVKVVDFGLAGFVQTLFSLARSSQLNPAGTPEYGAPEQFLKERGDVRSDLYALGGVLFALLTGQAPFNGHSGMAVVHRKLNEDAPSLRTLRADLPPSVTQLVADLLQRDPDRRPQTAMVVQERLGRLRASLYAPGLSAAANGPAVPRRATVVRPAPRTQAIPRAGRAIRKVWRPIALGSVLGLAISAGLCGGYLWTQTQYYVSTKGEHAAIHRGVSQDLAWVSLSSVQTDRPDIEYKYLPPFRQRQLQATIAADSLEDARRKLDDLGVQVSACKKDEERRLAEENHTTPPPSLSPEEQQVVSLCGK
ncbi:serine/threonine-protein kinase [Streptomyces sp. MS1.HAVA.3]|uniref:non-specific serine/threonine protein kinase n=1 Tax=Streptomyces caledonius TaxID=3134107 RepID=A0ABU8TZU4_9ACTN